MRITNSYNILSAATANGVGNTVSNANDFQNLQLSVASASTADLTLRIQGSTQALAPDFSSAAAVGNQWDYVGFYDYNTATFTSGNTGLVFTGTDLFPNLLVNVDGLRWLNCEISGYVAGELTVSAMMMSNE